jgi:Protein of unknown function (DUF1552)
MAKMILSRRAVLRGALAGGGLATMPLPRLGAMLNGNGTAYAAGEPLRRIYGTWFWGNGVAPTQWTPPSAGADFTLSPQLMPFAGLKRHLTVVSGMSVKTGRTGAHLYHSGALTGSVGGANKAADLPSIDQLIANKIGTDTPFKSIEVGVSTASPRAGSPLYTNVSWRAANAPNPADFNPHSVFNRLFGANSPGAARAKGAGMSATPAPDTSGLAAVRKSVLDAVTQDARALSARLGVEDRQRLDKHLEGIRSLEKRLEQGPSGNATAGCHAGADSQIPPDNKAEAPPELNKVMADLLVAALSCDLTRVFTFIFTYPAAHVYFRNLGQNKDFHAQICHGEGGDQPSFNAGVIYTMQSWAYLLGEMDKIKEGEGTMLDNALVYGSTCVAWGRNHAFQNWPVMMFGRAGGALKGNFHLAAPDDNLSKVAFTIGNIFGLGLKEFGKGGGLVNAELPAIRA